MLADVALAMPSVLRLPLGSAQGAATEVCRSSGAI